MLSKTSKTKQRHSWQFEAIGTGWVIETHDEISFALREKISRRVEAFDATYSRFRDDSLVAKMSQQAGEYDFPADAPKIMDFYRKLYDATGRVVTPLIGDSLVAAGYDKDYLLDPTAPLAAKKWDDVMSWDGAKVVTKQPFVMDIGAAGKGLLVDEIADVLEAADIRNYVIDASGDIRHRGDDTEIVGLENPNDPTKVVGVAKLQNASLCASATNRRRWADGWHHVLDGRTGEPTSDVVATWVIADSTMVADGVATALFFVGSDKLQGLGGFEYVRLMANGKIEKSENFVGELYI
jgi:thiamine biosynthesis lipoprotein